MRFDELRGQFLGLRGGAVDSVSVRSKKHNPEIMERSTGHRAYNNVGDADIDRSSYQRNVNHTPRTGIVV
jgi:hypothetical protein